MPLILASTSRYRRQLLERLQLPFEQVAPDFTELKQGTLPPEELVMHNTLGKANAVLAVHPEATVIASDQLAVCGEHVLGKPGTAQAACRQLEQLSGQRVSFLTGLALISRRHSHSDMIRFDVCFRKLSREEIQNYVDREQPIDCAGSFKSEGLGISLFERMCGDDPTALIRLSQWLQPLR